MKSLKILVIVTVILVVVFLCSGFVAAITQDQGTARALFSTGDTIQAGQPATVYVFFNSNSGDSLIVTAVSLHFDWMPTGQVVGYQLTTPYTMDNGSSHTFDPMQVNIPLNLVSGSHSYYVGIDGTENGATFSWDSTDLIVDIVGGTGNATATPISTNSGGQPAGQSNLVLFGAIGAVVVVVVLLVIVLMMRKNRAKSKQPKPETKQGTTQPETPSPEQKKGPEQDFTI